MSRRQILKKIFWAALLLGLAGLLAPLVITINFWRGRVAAALSRGLGRAVRVGTVHPKLFGGIGFEIDRVVVDEDPQFGAEPFARMEELRATIALGSLWEPQLRFSSLVFVQPSLNIVRNREGQWNLESLLRPSSGLQAAQHSTDVALNKNTLRSLPWIQVEGGRINFKSETRKKAYVINDVDMDIAPPGGPGEAWTLTFEGTPSRTDFPFNPVSHFRGQARLGPFSPGLQQDTGTLAKVELSTDGALLGDLLKIAAGTDYGIHAALDLNLRLSGTTSLLRVGGNVRLRELHRWDRLPAPSASAFRADIDALLDLDRDSLQLRSVSVPLAEGFVLVQGEIGQLLHHPQPQLQAQVRHVRLADVLELSKQFTPRVNERLTASGTLNGDVHIPGDWKGVTAEFAITGASVAERGTARTARLSEFTITLDGPTGHAGPIKIDLSKGGKISAWTDWNFSTHQASARLESDGVRLDTLLPWATILGSRWGQAPFTGGSIAFRATLSGSPGIPAKIAGIAQISSAVLDSASVNEPIRIGSARLQFQPGRINVKPFSAAIGPIELHGSFAAVTPPSATGDAMRHWQAADLDLQSPGVDIADLEKLLNPGYRPTPFFRFGAGANRRSTFLTTFAAQGTIRTDVLSYAENAIRNFKGSIDFRNGLLTVKTFSGDFAGGTQKGSATVKFSSDSPAFAIQSRFANIDLNQLTRVSPSWSGFFTGKISGALRISSSGWNLPAILERLDGSGQVMGTNLELDGIDLLRAGSSSPEPVTRIASIASVFRIAGRRVLFTEMKLKPEISGREKPGTLTLSGTVGFDRTLDLLVRESAVSQPYHWGGTLAEPFVTAPESALVHPASE